MDDAVTASSLWCIAWRLCEESRLAWLALLASRTPMEIRLTQRMTVLNENEIGGGVYVLGLQPTTMKAAGLGSLPDFIFWQQNGGEGRCTGGWVATGAPLPPPKAPMWVYPTTPKVQGQMRLRKCPHPENNLDNSILDAK